MEEYEPEPGEIIEEPAPVIAVDNKTNDEQTNNEHSSPSEAYHFSSEDVGIPSYEETEGLLNENENPDEPQHVAEEQQTPTTEQKPNAASKTYVVPKPNPDEDVITHNIFVGDLKTDVTEQDLFDAFSRCGEIHSVHIFRDPVTQEPKGFGFVHFLTKEAQVKALSDEFNHTLIKDRPCRVSVSEQRNTLFVGNVPSDMSQEEVYQAVCEIVPKAHITNLELKVGPPPALQSRGFCFIQFTSHSKADNARRILAQSTIKDRPLNVSWAENRTGNVASNDAQMAKVKTLYVSNLNTIITENILSTLFGDHGNVINCVICKNPLSHESRGFAFVEFEKREEALKAMEALDGLDLAAQHISVVLAKPAKKTTPTFKKGMRGSNPHAMNFNPKGRRGGSEGFHPKKRGMPGAMGMQQMYNVPTMAMPMIPPPMPVQQVGVTNNRKMRGGRGQTTPGTTGASPRFQPYGGRNPPKSGMVPPTATVAPTMPMQPQYQQYQATYPPYNVNQYPAQYATYQNQYAQQPTYTQQQYAQYYNYSQQQQQQQQQQGYGAYNPYPYYQNYQTQ